MRLFLSVGWVIGWLVREVFSLFHSVSGIRLGFCGRSFFCGYLLLWLFVYLFVCSCVRFVWRVEPQGWVWVCVWGEKIRRGGGRGRGLAIEG